MKVILKENVNKLGEKGDIVQVANGYARNYLIPRGLAEEASKSNLKKLEAWKKKIEAEREEERRRNKELAEKISMLQLKVESKAGEGGRLFGSVTGQDIATELKKQHGIEIDKKKIELPEPIKALGNFRVKIKIDAEHQPSLNLQVVEGGE